MELLIAAIGLGFLGSFHCVGMCGPIALALPVVQHNRFSKVNGVLLYNLGRIITYSMFGVLFGMLGKTFIISGYQRLLSVIIGAIILIGIFMPESAAYRFPVTKVIFSYVSKVKLALRKLFGSASYSSLFSIGVLNGLLPCGLVYTAVSGAILTANPAKGSLFMALFGLGTVPAMVAVALGGQVISLNWRNRMRKAVPLFVGMMGLMLILRGMNLGIPFVSPYLSNENCTVHKCCHR